MSIANNYLHTFSNTLAMRVPTCSNDWGGNLSFPRFCNTYKKKKSAYSVWTAYSVIVINRGKKHLSELTLSRIVNASAIGHSAQVVQCVHTGREVGVTQRLHRRLLKWSGKVDMLCDAVTSAKERIKKICG